MRRLVVLIVALAFALSLAACGKKGEIEPPPGKKSEFPRQYPR